MKRYSVQHWDRIFVKVYGLLSFAKNMGRNIGKNISKNLSDKYSQKRLDHAKQSAADALKMHTLCIHLIMHTYMLKELQQSQTWQRQMQPQIMPKK